ncbi:large-conductance mechanosensitive channel [Corynebacterium maris DSM 45190]|uniref:Large-conductance mechanosensitive channel n=1 Tax=Corynebacterium maris DSM 45190 TaxID=1224163 RepID=S5THW0_9CORY|nr:large-conductance mechanosensitive channel protein MscL [Corynebacterium maris]AGS34298.1 large-conductance mechanosensitive channel [Corynebacterium maris DSM 45190]MDO5453693.1 large-conductance mechanosensitive channel protein MscL [Corynebacterium sp.]
MLKGFRDFIMRGNVIDLAVAVVIGAAFTAIVTSFTQNLLDPLIASLGNPDVSGLGFHIRPGDDSTFLDFGAVITAIVNFLIVAAVIYFALVLPMNKLQEIQKRKQDVDPEEPETTEVQLLSEIRDLLADKDSSAKE